MSGLLLDKIFLRVIKALLDPNRVKIIKMLESKEMCVCELTAALGLAQPTVSKHLKLLEDFGLVGFRKEGSWVNYRLAVKSESSFAAVMLKQLKKWLNEEAVAEAGISADIEKVTDFNAIAGYGVFSTPAVVIDGQVQCVGKVPTKKEILA